MDLGCGTGSWLQAFIESGVTDVLGRDGAYAIDSGLRIPRELFEPTDLAQPIKVSRKFDLVLSLEVAEHLPEVSAPLFVRGLCESADVVVFSAAIPLQGGTQHVNCQWQSWWAGLFAAEGFRAVDIVRPRIWGDDRVTFWYQQNTVVYIKEGNEKDVHPIARPQSLDLVHPKLYLSPRAELSRLTSHLFGAVSRMAGR